MGGLVLPINVGVVATDGFRLPADGARRDSGGCRFDLGQSWAQRAERCYALQLRSIRYANERKTVMNKSTISCDQIDEEIVAFEVSDEALEAAACLKDKAGAVTLAFCSGLDTCPA